MAASEKTEKPGMSDQWEAAKGLLLSALGAVENLQRQIDSSPVTGHNLLSQNTVPVTSFPAGTSHSRPTWAGESGVGNFRAIASTSSFTPGLSSIHTTRAASAYSEYKRIFGFQPSVGKPKAPVKRGRASSSVNSSKKAKVKVTPWKKAICLASKDQTHAPTVEEKMELAKKGLGLKSVVFDSEGDRMHIHDALVKAFPEVDACGGYELLRVAGNSTDFLRIEEPKGGMTVKYLKDILKSAKLYIRPIQDDLVVLYESESSDEVRLLVYSVGGGGGGVLNAQSVLFHI